MSKAASTAARLQNDFGADLWVKNQAQARHATAGRGLFAGLQDVKHYNVENGWAKRTAANEQPGLIGLLWSRKKKKKKKEENELGGGLGIED
ncbi:hypothetical protein BDV30DRAFT_238851 [Aspergillus minisclerotigenes]|uniref:Uncharacterized protein n=1 Tax=Aspergillus minisclerotigenes TaxID=656917 RepID=A0A5N6J4L3_9EURO|nr:hypothetical protein BDV30DRAFT_238851 [Aspergillus minisclerotigenes]